MSVNFIDTNVFIYLFDETDYRKRRKAEELIQEALRTGTGSISFQVIQEALNVITGKLSPPATATDARRFMVTTLLPLWRVLPTRDLYERCLEVQASYLYGFYDSLIIAAALDAGCSRLYSEELQHGQRIGRIVIENPFLET